MSNIVLTGAARTGRPRTHIAGIAAATVLLALAAPWSVTAASASGSPVAAPGSAAAPTSATSPAAASAGKRPALATFGIDSATAGHPDTRYGLNFNLDPGAATKDHVAVVNNSATALTLDLYAADGVNSADGKVEYLPIGRPGTGARQWITLDSPSTIRVRARSTTIVGVTIAVPSTATPGDHLAGIVVSLPGKAQTSTGQKVEFDQGVGLATTFHVSGTLAPALKVDSLAATYDGTLDPFGSGSATVTYTVRNTGNVTLGAAQQLEVNGLFGSARPTREPAAILPLLPGNSVRESVRVNGVTPTFRVTAKVTLTPMAAPGEVLPTLAKVSASTGLWAVPWTLLALLVLLLLLGLATRAWRRAHPATESKHSARRGDRDAVLVGKA